MTFAEQLKSQLNIIDVVGHYVRLKRQGAGPRYVGLCPFHSEKTPSFGVHSALQIYKCFGCDAGGDVFKFVMEHDHLTFPEAIKVLAERYGIPMPERHRFDDPEAQKRSAILEMHEIAAQTFQDNLRCPAGKDAAPTWNRAASAAKRLRNSAWGCPIHPASNWRLGCKNSVRRSWLTQGWCCSAKAGTDFLMRSVGASCFRSIVRTGR